MGASIALLEGFKPAKKFFIGIDSDGCVFDSMEIKHKECFCPVFIKHFGLQPVSPYAQEVWEFVNLYSSSRGCNRFHAVLRAMQLLAERQEVKDKNFIPPRLAGLRDWLARESKPGNPALKAELQHNPDPDLQLVYTWSLKVNRAVRELVKNIPPFPPVRECLKKMVRQADTIVISQTPGETLRREWTAHSLINYVRLIAGQELGSKSAHLKYTTGGKYAEHHALMIGDAPGDYQAARDNQLLFYPINPGEEQKSWQRLAKETLKKFFSGTYHGSCEAALIRDFQKRLPVKASWQR